MSLKSALLIAFFRLELVICQASFVIFSDKHFLFINDNIRFYENSTLISLKVLLSY